MAKTLENGLSMIETNLLNHNWSHFVILLGLTLHQFQKKLLLRIQLCLHKSGARLLGKLTICVVAMTITTQGSYMKGNVLTYCSK